MARTATAEVHSDDTAIEQKPNVVIDPKNRESDVVVASKVPLGTGYLDELKFNEEPVTIMIAPRSEENAATTVPIWNNGKGCEVWNEQTKSWLEITHVPTGMIVTVKRKYVAQLASAKQDRVKTLRTNVEDLNDGRANNIAQRITTALCSFSVIEDRNPRGAAWLQELLRRNY